MLLLFNAGFSFTRAASPTVHHVTSSTRNASHLSRPLPMFQASLSLQERCHLCHKLIRRDNMRRHHRDIHLRMRTHTCQFCGCSFSQKSTLESHLLRLHPEQPTFACPSCNKVYMLQEHLEQHLQYSGHGVSQL